MCIRDSSNADAAAHVDVDWGIPVERVDARGGSSLRLPLRALLAGETGGLRARESDFDGRAGPVAARRRGQSPPTGRLDACGDGPTRCDHMAGSADEPSSRAQHDGAASLTGRTTGRTTQRDPAVRTIGAGKNGMSHC
eukprot:5351093-Alexandrium_andersonii.AAC.2